MAKLTEKKLQSAAKRAAKNLSFSNGELEEGYSATYPGGWEQTNYDSLGTLPKGMTVEQAKRIMAAAFIKEVFGE